MFVKKVEEADEESTEMVLLVVILVPATTVQNEQFLLCLQNIFWRLPDSIFLFILL